ncbi:MAG: small multi-drug export protein [Cyclobacteriaceae bacterium]
MFKFIAGPTVGSALGMNRLEIIIVTSLGMMSSVIVMSFFGIQLRKWYLNKYHRRSTKKLFTKRNRRIVFVWRHYGTLGISMLTPIIFSPMIGALIVTLLGAKRKKVFAWMLVSAVFWSVVFSYTMYWIVNF